MGKLETKIPIMENVEAIDLKREIESDGVSVYVEISLFSSDKEMSKRKTKLMSEENEEETEFREE